MRDGAPRPIAHRGRASHRTRYDAGSSIETGDETRNSDETSAAKMRATDGNAG